MTTSSDGTDPYRGVLLRDAGVFVFFICFLLYSVYFFVVSFLVVHLSNHSAIQLYWAITVIDLVACYLTLYALLTEPQGVHSLLYWLGVASKNEEASLQPSERLARIVNEDDLTTRCLAMSQGCSELVFTDFILNRMARVCNMGLLRIYWVSI